jgi:hypothetical protein
MKVFISHKQEDSLYAKLVKRQLDLLNVDSYLDVLDTSINGGGEALTDHIKDQLNSCTDIIVVMSEATKYSWWVPFEIGMAAQIDMPTATYLTSSVGLPDYLTYWPRLKSISDVATYVTVRNEVSDRLRNRHPYSYPQPMYRPYETATFYDEVKRKLR